MSSIVEGYNYDIFISYRQKDNKGDRWVSEFVEALKTELESTFKEEISVYFDINPHDGLLETHDVDESLKEKLKCIIFIPIISRTFCDPKSFAWEHEFKAFVEMSSIDQFGLKIRLQNGNVTGRVLPVQIHDISSADKTEIEKVLGGIMRPVEFIYKEPGVNRPLRSNEDHPENNHNKTIYRNQINKVANAIDEIITGIKKLRELPPDYTTSHEKREDEKSVTVRKHQKNVNPRTRKIIISALVAILLIIIAILIFLSRIIVGGNIKDMTRTVSITNEYGGKELRRVFKEDFITKLSIFPFVNETNDSLKNWMRYGLMDATVQDLLQFNYISVRGNKNITHLQEQIKDSRINIIPAFLTGTYNVSDGIYHVTSKLYQSENGSVISERTYNSNDFFSIIDSISLYTRTDLGIPLDILGEFPDLPFKEHSTNNLEAYRFYVTGLYQDSLIYNLYKSIQLDSTYAIALYNRAYNNFLYQLSHESACKDIGQAMRHRKRLSENDNIATRILYYMIQGETEKAISLSEMQYTLLPTVILLEKLSDVYATYFKIPELEDVTIRLDRIIPDHPNYQIWYLCYSYLFSGEYEKGIKLTEKILAESPENYDALLMKGELYLNKNEYEAAKSCYQKAIMIRPENEKALSWIFDHISYLKKNPAKRDFLDQFAGSYRFEDIEMTCNFFIHNDHAIIQAKNQWPLPQYPVSDSEFVSSDGVHRFTFVRNDRNEIIKSIYNRIGYKPGYLWKEDTLIIKALKLLNENDKLKALNAFRIAYSNNPDHHYLADFINHLEFIQSREYTENETLVEAYVGHYGIRRIYKKDDVLFYQSSNGNIYKLLPISEDNFMSPSFYDAIIHLVRKNNQVIGLEFNYRDGRKEYMSRNKE